MGCFFHPHFLVLINGMSKGFFCSSRGLRQGDPLSPFLFMLVANVFSALMSITDEKCIINGFEASEDGPSVSHLQFVDDTICFVDADIEQVTNLQIILKMYECISGLKVNLSKSCTVEVGVNGDMFSIHVNTIGCKVED